MEQVHKWDGYRGEFSKTGGGIVSEGVMKAIAYGISRMTPSLLDTVASSHKPALKIALARVHPDEYKPRMCKENLEVTGRIQNRLYTGNLKGPEEASTQVVIKQLFCRGEEVWKIRDMMLHLSSDRIEHLIGAFYEQGTFFVTELTLGSWDTLRQPVSAQTTLTFGIQLLEALQWMHSKGIIHCDVQPENCLIRTNKNLVLANFKDAVILKEGYEAVRLNYLRARTGFNDMESLVSKEVNQLYDVFGAACTIYEMDTGTELCKYYDEMYTTEQLEIWANQSEVHAFDIISETKTPHQAFLQRIGNSNFHQILRMMVVGRKDRFNATEVLMNTQTKRLMNTYSIDFKDLDYYTEPLVSELSVQETDMGFYRIQEPNETEEILDHYALGGIYFDADKWSTWNDLIASKNDLVGFFDKYKDCDWLLKLVYPILKITRIKRLIQKKIGKRVPSGFRTVITREASKIVPFF